MNRFLIAIAIALTLALSPTVDAFGAQYVGVDLYLLSGFSVSRFSGDGGQVVGHRTGGIYVLEAVVMGNSPGSTLSSLHPNGFNLTNVAATDGVSQVGRGSGEATGHTDHALLWQGTAQSFVDLHPSQFAAASIFHSGALGVRNNQQVGYGRDAFNSVRHALLWSGSAESAVDLHPAVLVRSTAVGTDGIRQVGSVGVSLGSNETHAALWSGTATSFIDLHPISGYSHSNAFNVEGAQQVGSGVLTTPAVITHALLWTGTAASAVDLHPTNLSQYHFHSVAVSTNGAQQVGYFSTDRQFVQPRAVMWNGTADSAVNLHDLLPAGFIDSVAGAVDMQGTVWGWATGADGIHAVKWVPVPEPSAFVLAVIGMTATFTNIHRRGSRALRRSGD